MKGPRREALNGTYGAAQAGVLADGVRPPPSLVFSADGALDPQHPRGVGDVVDNDLGRSPRLSPRVGRRRSARAVRAWSLAKSTDVGVIGLPVPKRYASRLPLRKLDDGTLRVRGVHVGDGYYEITCECDVCGTDATQTLTARKEMAKAIGDRWFSDHHHNP